MIPVYFKEDYEVLYRDDHGVIHIIESCGKKYLSFYLDYVKGDIDILTVTISSEVCRKLLAQEIDLYTACRMTPKVPATLTTQTIKQGQIVHSKMVPIYPEHFPNEKMAKPGVFLSNSVYLPKKDTELEITVEPCPDIPGQYVAKIQGLYNGMAVDLVTQGNDPFHALRMVEDCLRTAFDLWEPTRS